MIWNRSEVRRAHQIPLKPVLERLGYRLNPIANDNYIVIGFSPDIVVKNHCLYDSNGQEGGNL